MPTLASYRLPIPSDWQEFEKIVLAYSKIRWPDNEFNINGRLGQTQNGVDIFGHRNNGTPIGIQCKHISKPITKGIIKKEVTKASKFIPLIKEFFIATTLQADAKIQQFIRTENQKFLDNHGFTVEIIFWDAITIELCKDFSTLRIFYPELLPAIDHRSIDHDINILTNLIRLFDGDTLAYFKEPDFICKVRDKILTPLFIFAREWDSLEHNFINLEIEKKKNELHTYACSFAEEIAGKTVFSNNSAFRTVIPENHSITDQYRSEAKILNDYSRQFSALFHKFIQESRAILYK